MRDSASRREARSFLRDSVTSFSTTGRSSFALGSVVLICSCLISAAAMLANMAWRCCVVVPSFPPALRWRMILEPCHSPASTATRVPGTPLILILVTLCQILDVLRRPARHFHAKMQPHLRQHRLNLVQRLAAEVRRAEHFRLRLLYQVADIDDVVVLETISGAYRQLQLIHFLEQHRIEGEIGLGFLQHALAGLFEVDENLELVLQDTRGIGNRVVRRN